MPGTVLWFFPWDFPHWPIFFLPQKVVYPKVIVTFKRFRRQWYIQGSLWHLCITQERVPWNKDMVLAVQSYRPFLSKERAVSCGNQMWLLWPNKRRLKCLSSNFLINRNSGVSYGGKNLSDQRNGGEVTSGLFCLSKLHPATSCVSLCPESSKTSTLILVS